jgi:hypothetical protein
MAIAYETGIPTSQQDLLDKFRTFLVAQTWTQDEWDTVNKRMSIHRGTVYVQFRWDGVASTGCIGVYHSLDFTPGAAPGAHPDDSGNGQTTANPITTGRRFRSIGNGPFTSYHFFTDPAKPYAVLALEWAAGCYAFGYFGLMDKVGTWTGGEYCGVTWWNDSSVNAYAIAGTSHHRIFDGTAYSTAADVTTVHLEGMPHQNADSKWAAFWPTTLAALGNDRAGKTRYALGGLNWDGPLGNDLVYFGANPMNGFIPMFPTWVLYRDKSTTAPENWIPLGSIADCRYCNIKYLEPQEEVVIGGQTWKFFPHVRKQNISQSGVVESKNMGYAFRKA